MGFNFLTFIRPWSRPEVLIGLSIFVIALVMLGVFTSGLTQQYIIGGSGARQCPGNLGTGDAIFLRLMMSET